MANVVEYIVKMRDLMSGQWKGLANNADGAFNRLNSRMRTTGSSVDQLNAKINALTKTRDMSLNTSAIARANREIDSLEKKRDKLQNTGWFTSGMGGMLRTGLGLAGIGGGAYLIKDIMQAGMERQMNLTALQTLLGANNGNALNGQLLNFAKKSIYGNEVFTEGKLMAGSGIAPGNIMPVMKMIGDIAMGSKERMQSLALAFSEANTRGSLTGINERMFLQGGLFNPLQQLHLMTGRSMADLKKDMEKGKIGIDELVKAMEYATGPMGRYYQMTEKMQHTPAGQWTAFTGTVRTLAGDIGLKLLPVLGGVTTVLQKITNNPDSLYLIANGIGAMTAAWGLYSIAANWAAIQSAALEIAAYWPVALGVGILGGVIAICSANNTLAGNTETTSQRISNAANLISDSWTNAIYTFKTAWLGIQSVWQRYSNVVNTAASPWWEHKSIYKALTGDTEADSTLAKLKAAHVNWMQDKKAIADGFSPADPKTGKLVKPGVSPLDGLLNGKYKPGGGGSGVPDGVGATAAGITGGGVRNMTININKLGTDQITIHTTNLKEGAAEVQRMFIEMFNQVINSGNAAVSPQ